MKKTESADISHDTSHTKKGLVPAIVSEGHPALRQVADEIPLSEIKSEKIQRIIADMKLALASQDDGIGLAAPQIGIPLRIFLVSKKIFSTHKANGEDIQVGKNIKTEEKSGQKSETDKVIKADSKTQDVIDDLVFINPILVKESKEKKWMEGEGCLSVRWIYGKVRRSTKVTIRAFDEHGKAFERGAGGLLAHIFQHEVDHLNGVLFIDKAKDLEEVDPKEQKQSRKSSTSSAKKK